MTVVIDANVAVAVCFELPYSRAAKDAFARWHCEDQGIYAVPSCSRHRFTPAIAAW